MPWNKEDVEKHIKGLNDKQKEVWVRVANGALDRCLKQGRKQEECEVSAIRQANAVARKVNAEVDETPHVVFNDVGEVVLVEYESKGVLKDVEVFAAGEWNGDKYTEADLDEMVRAFKELKGKWKPVVKLGHKAQPKDATEQPALGFVTELKRKGKKLLATISNVPKTLMQAIKNGLYGRRSAEVLWNYRDEGKKYPRVLSAVAILGSSIPAVTTLADISKFLTQQNESGELHVYELGEERREYMIVWKENLEHVVAEVHPESAFDVTTLKENTFSGAEGVRYVGGVLKEGQDERVYIQSWLFDRRKWTMEEAKKWLNPPPLPLSESRPYTVEEWRGFAKVMKTEDGVQYPKEAYLYVPDPEKPSTWKLRIWEDPDKKVTRVQLGRAVAALSPGGFRGRKVELPPGETKKVKQKLVALYRKLGVPDEEIPKHLFSLKEDEEMTEKEFAELIKRKDEEIAQLTGQVEQLKEAQRKATEEEAKKLQQELEAKEAEISELKKYRDEAEQLRKKAEEVEAKNRELELKQKTMEVQTFVKDLKAQGKVLPRDEELVTQLLLYAPEKKEYQVKDEKGESKEASLADMIRIYLTRQDSKVSFTEQLGNVKGDGEFASVGQEVDAKVKAYMAEHRVKYAEAFEAVLKADPDLAKRYAEFKE